MSKNPNFSEKYQAGESYADNPKPTKANFFADPVQAANDIFKDCVNARLAISFPELVQLIKGLITKGQPVDDRKGTTEVLVGIIAALPSTSHSRTFLTHKLIDTLWGDLDHPPMTYVGGDVKYKIADGKKSASKDEKKHKKYDVVEFEVPGTGVRLREEVPDPPNGVHQYRRPDGSCNNILAPHIGRAGAPYAKSVRSSKNLHGVKPDAGQLFDLLMAREKDDFKENPAGISSMLFYHASIITHDIFRTSRTDMNKSDTSSYLDLAPLYGSSLRDQVEVRTMKEGKLKPDTFSEKRLLGQPAGINVMLILYNRYHNYVADILLKINEGGRFTLACMDDASPEERAKALAKQDHDLFNTARLITVAMYVSISLGDYLRGIMNLHTTNTDWAFDPRLEVDEKYDGEGIPRGGGNQVSVEFNLLYRFHSCISKRDERWINDFFLKLFPGRNVDDLEDVSLPELGRAMMNYEKTIPADPSKRTFGEIERKPDGYFHDEDLVRILKESMEDPAGLFGARTVPKALKIIEIQGINQARKWGCASLNEFREFFGLRRYEKFDEINSDEHIARVLENIYTHPDMVEMYPGMMIEDAKPPRDPGLGACVPYTVGRAVLADAVTLVRSDRFNTLDYSNSTLTAWGMNEVQGDPKTLGKSMLYKLIQRGLPGWFPFNSVSVMQPMYTKKKNIELAKRLGTYHHYTEDDPSPPTRPVLISSWDGIKHVLDTPKKFPSRWTETVNAVFSGTRNIDWFMLSADEPANFKNRKIMAEAFGVFQNIQQTVHEFVDRVGTNLLNKEAFELKKGLHQIDLVRDVAIPLNTQLLADMFYLDLRTDENPDGTLSIPDLYKALLNFRIWGANNTDPAESWNRRRRAAEGCDLVLDSSRKLIDEVIKSRGLGFGISSALAQKFTRQSYLKKNSLRSHGFKIVDFLVGQGMSLENIDEQLLLMGFGGIGVLVTTFYEVMDFFLRPENEKIWSQVQDLASSGNTDKIQKYVLEAQRLVSDIRNVRFAGQQTEVEGKQVRPGDMLVLDIANAARDPKHVSSPEKFDPERKTPEISAYSYGQHNCLGRAVAASFVAGLVKLAAGLKELRPAPGAMGSVKKIHVGFDRIFLNDSWSYFAFNVNTWKVQFHGHGKGCFHGDNKPKDGIPMQQYYYGLKKRKAADKQLKN